MNIFSRNKVSIQDIIDGLLQVLNESREAQNLYHEQQVEKFIDAENGEQMVKTIKIGDQEITLPLQSLSSPETVGIKEMSVTFNAKIKDLAQLTTKHGEVLDKPLNYADLELIMSKINVNDNSNITINITFK